MIIVDCIQGEPSWYEARLGRVTASLADKVITAKKLQRSTQIETLICRLVGEWSQGAPDEEWRGNDATEHGKRLEPRARAVFDLETGYEVRSVGFIYRDEARDCGCSPDGLVLGPSADHAIETDIGRAMPILTLGGLELKCPWKNSRHIAHWRAYQRTGAIPAEYWLQVQFSLWVTQLPRWWFMSYSATPNMPALIAEVKPDEATQSALDEVMPEVLGEIAECRAWLEAEGVEPEPSMYVREVAE